MPTAAASVPFAQQLQKHVAKVHSVEKLDALQAIIDGRRAEILEEERMTAERKALLESSGAHVIQAEHEHKPIDMFKESDADKTWWSSSVDLKRAPAGTCPERPSLYKPHKDERLGGWVGGPKWMFSRTKKRAGTESWQKNRNEPLMEADMQVCAAEPCL